MHGMTNKAAEKKFLEAYHMFEKRVDLEVQLDMANSIHLELCFVFKYELSVKKRTPPVGNSLVSCNR